MTPKGNKKKKKQWKEEKEEEKDIGAKRDRGYTGQRMPSMEPFGKKKSGRPLEDSWMQ